MHGEREGGGDSMSVIKSKRGESEMEFIHTARELQAHTIRKCVSFPKRYTFYVGQPLAECAFVVHDRVKCANSTFPTNRHEAQRRIDYLAEAYAKLQSMVSQVELANELFGIGDDAMEYWMEIIYREMRLVKGVMKRDRAS